jgi:hypothetical protein
VNQHDNRKILVEKVYMRPIFSDGTDNSELTHNIQWWVNKHGVELLPRGLGLRVDSLMMK